MSSTDPASERSGISTSQKILLIIGVILLGVSLRSAVTGMSPLLTSIRAEINMGDATATLLNMLPTLAFGVAGFAAASMIRKTTPEITASIAMVLAALGLAVRAFVGEPVSFLIFSVIALFGMGMGNVVGAPLVKKHFADNPAPMLTLFALLMQAGATIPSFIAVPLANGTNWRVSVGSWAILSIAAAIPWVLQIGKSLKEKSGVETLEGKKDNPYSLAQLLTNPVSVGTALFYASASLITYAMLGWLPTILQSFGQSEESAGLGYSIFTFMTLPLAAIVPYSAQKMKKTVWLMLIVTGIPIIGFVGLLLTPDAYVLWSILIGMIGGAFPLAIAHFNMRTSTTEGSGALSGFAMGVGYLFGTLGPLVGGWISSATGAWNIPVIVYIVVGVIMIFGGLLMTKPGRFLEDRTKGGSQA